MKGSQETFIGFRGHDKDLGREMGAYCRILNKVTKSALYFNGSLDCQENILEVNKGGRR